MTLPALAALTTVAAMLALGAVLLITKSVNSWRARFEAIRRASYIAVFGELTARGSYPLDILSSWSDDRVFRTALVDFMRLLDGVERDRLLRVARDLGIVDSAIIALRKARRAKTRVQAASMLSELADPKTVRPLMAALEDPEAGVRINAAAALAKIGEPAAIEAILKRIDEETEWDAARAMDHLATLGAAAVDGLLSYLGDLSERVPRYAHLAIQTLGEIGDLRAEPALLAALQNPVTELRLVAAGALQTGGSLESVGPLIAAMSDEDGRVRARAAKSLGAHFDTRAIEPLYEGLHDTEWWVRKNSAAALAALPDGIPALQRALRDDDAFARDAAREQLMILGVPAGKTDSVEPEAVEHAHDWIEEQLRELEREAEAATHEDSSTRNTQGTVAAGPVGGNAAAPYVATDSAENANDEPSPANDAVNGKVDPTAVTWPYEPGLAAARMGGVPPGLWAGRSRTDPPVNGGARDATGSAVPVAEVAEEARQSGEPALGATSDREIPAADVGVPALEGARADSLTVLDLTLESHGLGSEREDGTAASQTRRAS